MAIFKCFKEMLLLNAKYFHCCNTKQLLTEKNEIIEIIKENTILTNDHLSPEIKLHLITPNCKLWTCNMNSSPFKDPYWAFYWPGGQAISRYLLDNVSIVKNLTVLEIGCGSAACSITAAIAGSKRVIANDIDPVACAASALNASVNNVTFDICMQDLLGHNDDEELSSMVDCVIIGDMFYDDEFAAVLFRWLLRLHQLGKTILIGDPGRLPFHKTLVDNNRMKCLSEYNLLDNSCLDNNGFVKSSVWTIN